MKLALHSTALDGRTVTLTLMQDGVSVGPLTIDAWGAPLPTTTPPAPLPSPSPGPTASVTVEITRSKTQTAPEGVFFKVTNWQGFETQKGAVAGYDARQMDLIHIWSFGDPSSSHQIPEKLLPEWRDANTARGPFVAHVYEKPGDHDWSLTVIEPATGRIATASGRITVANPDVTFAGAGTVYVSQTGNYADCPASVPPAQRFTSLKAALASVASRTTGSRIMLARGQDFSVAVADGENHDRIFLDHPEKGPIHLVAGPGTGTKPRFVLASLSANLKRMGGAWYGFTGGEFVVSNIRCQGNWDSTTETGVGTGAFGLGHPGLNLFTRCEFNGLDPWGCVPHSNPAAGAFIAHACHATNGKSYAIFGKGCAKYAFLGTQMTHLANARSGANFRFPAPPANSSGAIRIENEGPTDMFVDGCDFFTRCGWFDNVPAFRTIQPCLRFNTDSIAGCFLNVQRSSFEGGNTMVSTTRQHSGEVGVVTPLLFEHCIMVASHMTREMIASPGMGFAVRSCLFINPNKPSATWDFALMRVVDAVYTVGKAGNSSQEYPELYLPKGEITGCTFIDLSTTANTMGRVSKLLERSETKNPNPFGPVVVENNIVHKPNLNTPAVPSGPLDQTPLWAPRERHGPIVSYTQVSGTFPARFHRGDVLTLPWPSGTTHETFTAPGAPNPRSVVVSGPPMRFEHTVAGVRVTNIGTTTADDRAAGSSYKIELDRSNNPALFPQYATPADSVWRGTPLAGSAAIGAAVSDDVPHADLRGRVRPLYPSVGAMEP